ncbi:MAG: ion transporter [Balneolales bacterium]
MAEERPDINQKIEHERLALLGKVNEVLETPMVILAFVWLALFVAEVIWGLTPFLEGAGYLIWFFFLLDFAISFTLAPRKLTYLRSNWLKAISLLVPALRIFRIIRVLRIARLARATRGLRLLRLISSVNRGMRALGSTMRRRAFGYVVVLTVIVAIVGGAGMYSFERDVPNGQGFETYWSALWWTAMLLTTIGSEFWPQTGSGRALSFLLAIYSLGVLGYITAILATFFLGRDAEDEETELASSKSVKDLKSEITALREELRGK